MFTIIVTIVAATIVVKGFGLFRRFLPDKEPRFPHSVAHAKP